MDDKDFYSFRTEMRKRLGRIYFYPKDINVYVDEIVQLKMTSDIYTKENPQDKEIVQKYLDKIKKY